MAKREPGAARAALLAIFLARVCVVFLLNTVNTGVGRLLIGPDSSEEAASTNPGREGRI